MSISKVIIAKSTKESPVAMVLAGPELDDMFMAMSTDKPREKRGWVNTITHRMLDKKFTVLPTIVQDVSDIEAKHHEIWRWHGAQFDPDKFCEELYAVLFDHVNDTFELNKQITEVMGDEPTITELVSFTKWATINHKLDYNQHPTMHSLIESEGIQKIVFSFEHREPNSYRDHWGWAIYDPSQQMVCVTYCPEEFFNHISGNKCLYVGYIRLYGCVKSSDGIHCESSGILLDSILQHLRDMETITQEDNKRIDTLTL